MSTLSLLIGKTAYKYNNDFGFARLLFERELCQRSVKVLVHIGQIFSNILVFVKKSGVKQYSMSIRTEFYKELK